MGDFWITTGLCDAAVDDVIGDPHLLCDIADSSLWDIPSNVEESCDFNILLEFPDDITHIHDETADGQRKVSDNTTALSAGLAFDSRGASVSGGLRQTKSKNAILARENREKKKRYVCGLEKTVRDLSVRNKKLVQGCTTMRNTIANLRHEVNYLRGVLENQSELARLLKHIPVADRTRQLQVNANLSLSDDESEMKCASQCIDQPTRSLDSSQLIHTESALMADCESLLTEHDYARSLRQERRNNSLCHQFGVCLHVANQVTSLQLCASCNENARDSKE